MTPLQEAAERVVHLWHSSQFYSQNILDFKLVADAMNELDQALSTERIREWNHENSEVSC